MVEIAWEDAKNPTAEEDEECFLEQTETNAYFSTSMFVYLFIDYYKRNYTM